MKRLLFISLLSPLVFSNEMPIQASEDSTNKNDLIVRAIIIEKNDFSCHENAYEYISMIKQELDKGLNFQKASYCYASTSSGVYDTGGNLGYFEPDIFPEEFNLNKLNANQVSEITDYDDYYSIFTLSTVDDIAYSKSNCPLIEYKDVCPYKADEADEADNEICGSALNGLRYQEEFLKKFPKSDKRALRSARKNYQDCVKIYLRVPD